LGFIMDILVWLRRLVLGQYEAVFRKNEFDETVLPGLTAGDLKNSASRLSSSASFVAK
jgi:hypothetical protein